MSASKSSKNEESIMETLVRENKELAERVFLETVALDAREQEVLASIVCERLIESPREAKSHIEHDSNVE